MNISDEKRRSLFNLLDEMSNLDQNELEQRFSENVVNAMRLVQSELKGSEKIHEITTLNDFVDLVHSLREVKRTFSRKLGNAIILAEDSATNGQIDEAIEILRNFQKTCPSPFYNKNAQLEIERYQRQKTE